MELTEIAGEDFGFRHLTASAKGLRPGCADSTQLHSAQAQESAQRPQEPGDKWPRFRHIFAGHRESPRRRRRLTGSEGRLRQAVAEKSPRLSARRFGGRKVALGMENATDIVIDDAAG
jgi:hypothetical protein